MNRALHTETDSVLRTAVRQLRCAIYTRKSTEEGLLADLERLSKRQAAETQEHTQPQKPAIVLPSYEERPDVAMQLDMRGWRVEDALAELDGYLNDAVMSGLAAVRIVHGKGTGALRQAVRERLARHSLVKSYASAPPQEGGDGVTIVKFSA